MERVTLVYDGSCGLCRRSAGVATRLVPGVRLLDYHDRAGLRRVGVSLQEAERRVVLVVDGRKVRGYDTVVWLLCRGGWRVVCWVMRLRAVRWVGWWVYEVVSRWRHQVSWGLGLE